MTDAPTSSIAEARATHVPHAAAATLTGPARPEAPRARPCPFCESARTGVADGLARCGRCGLLYRGHWSAGTEQAYWSGYLDDDREQAYDARRQSFFGTYWRRLRGLPRTTGGRKCVLDVGCVPGQLLREARAEGWEVHGVETSEALCALTRGRVPAVLHCGFVEEIDFGRKRFDLVVMSNAFRHFARPRAALDACVRVLKPGGVLAVREMNGAHRRYAARRRDPYAWDMQLVTPSTLGSFLHEAGLADVRLWNSPVSLLTVPRLARVSARAPGLVAVARAGVNAGLRAVDPFTAGRGVPVTPLFLMAGCGAASPRDDIDLIRRGGVRGERESDRHAA